MGSEDGLVEIHPRELRFLFEVKKQSSCSVHLVNKTDEYVAFKVKTTSPKRYCVRPNTGVILPRATCDFTVFMQAQRAAPPDLQIKDKFLVQTTVIPFGTSSEGIVPAFFSKESGRYIEESKLRVVLVSATQPEVVPIINDAPNALAAVEVQVPLTNETASIVNEVPTVVNEVPHPLKTSFPPLREIPDVLSKIPLPEKETPVLGDFQIPSKEAPATSAEPDFHLKETPTVSVDTHFSSTETSKPLKESSQLKDTSTPKEFSILSDESVSAENIHLSHVTEDVHYLKSKHDNLQVKLEEAEILIIKLREEIRISIKERDKLRHDMVFLKRNGNPRSQVGFPLLFVVYMAILGASLGYLLHI